MPETVNAAPPRKSRTPLIIGIVLGALSLLFVIILVIALIIFFALRGGGGGGGGPVGGEEKPATPEEQATALVTDYMDALVAGDATTALELAPPLNSEDQGLLPDEAYAAALEAAPVTVVAISEPVFDSERTGTVSVDFTVGETPTSHEFNVSDHNNDGTWEMIGIDASANVPASLNGLGITLNGAAVEDEQALVLLPGAYTVASSAEHFALSSEDPLLVTAIGDSPEFPDPVLTEDGQSVFRGAVQKAVEGCLAETTLAAGCGIGELPATTSDGWTITEGTVKRAMPEDTQRNIDKMVGTPSYDEPAYVEGESLGTIDTTMECTKDGQTGTCEMWMGGGMGIPKVDMADPELPVTWS